MDVERAGRVARPGGGDAGGMPVQAVQYAYDVW